jgi:hypothetical protein
VIQAGLGGVLTLGLADLSWPPVAAADLAPDAPARINVRATGHTLAEVLAAVSTLAPWELKISRSIASERVAIAFQNGTLSAFMNGLASLFRYAWVEGQEADGKTFYRLEPLRSTLALEARLRRLPYLTGRKALREETLQELAKSAQEPHRDQPKPQYMGAGAIRGHYFVSLLSDRELEKMFGNEYVVMTVGQFTPVQREALWQFVRERLESHVSGTPERALLESLTPARFDQTRVVLRGRPSRETSLVQLSVPEARNSISVALRSKDLDFPQGVNPYAYIEGRAEKRPEAFTMKAPVDVQVPADWADVVPILREVTGKNVFSDYYADWLDRDGPRKRYQAQNGETFLDQLCRRFEKIWWHKGSTIFVRDKAWYSEKLEEPPLALQRRFADDIRAGRIQQTTLRALAKLTRPQLLTLLEQTWYSDMYAVSEGAFADFLKVFATGGFAQRQAILGNGLRLDQFSTAQIKALQSLAPDSWLRRKAETDPANSVLRMVQEMTRKEGEVKPPPDKASLRLTVWNSRSLPLGMDLRVPKKKAERLLVVSRAG